MLRQASQLSPSEGERNGPHSYLCMSRTVHLAVHWDWDNTMSATVESYTTWYDLVKNIYSYTPGSSSIGRDAEFPN